VRKPAHNLRAASTNSAADGGTVGEVVLEFRISSARVGADGWIVSLVGEIDLYTVPQLERELDRALAEGCRHVVVDLGGATFIDSTGLGVVFAARRRVLALGGSFVVATDDARIMRVFEIAGLDRRIHIEPSLSQALETSAAAERP
jgi:anti-sigma B factor antagonist